MDTATAHVIALALGLLWLAFVLLVHRSSQIGWLILLTLYGIAAALILAGFGVIPIPSVFTGGA